METVPVKIISKKDFAELAGVGGSAVTLAKKKLGAAVVGKKINLLHPNAQAYIKDKPLREARYGPRNSKKLSSVSSEDVRPDFTSLPVPKNIPKPVIPDELANLTLQEIVNRYGSLSEFHQFVSVQKNLSDYLNKNHKFEVSRKILIDKNSQGKILFEFLELLANRLLNDIPMTLSKRVIPIVKNSGDEAFYLVQKECHAQNSRALQICKDTLIRNLQT